MADDVDLVSVVIVAAVLPEPTPKPKLRSVTLAQWFGDGPKTIQIGDNSDVGNYPTKRPME